MFIKKIFKFFDKLEDKVRSVMSRHPIIYSFVGGVAIVLFWRGVWITADEFEFMNGPVSIVLSTILLLITGLFVSFFVGDRIILSGLKHEKKLTERTEAEVEEEKQTLSEVKAELRRIEEKIDEIRVAENIQNGGKTTSVPPNNR